MPTTSGLQLTSVSDALAALEHASEAIRAGEIAQALAIAAVCDLHRVDESKLVEGCERWVPGGADGTPRIGEFIAAEIGALLGVSPAGAMIRIARVLNVRHRHPVLWQAFAGGALRFYEATQVADACASAGLSAQACQWVDRQCAISLAMQPWSRVRTKIDRWILLADPGLAAERAARAAEARDVGVGQIKDGHCDLWGRLDAADGIALDQALTTIAGTLTTNGEDDNDANTADGRPSLGHRRATALGILARNALGQPELPRPAEIIIRIDATPVAQDAMPSPISGRSRAESAPTPSPHTTPSAELAPLPLSPVAEVQGWGAILTKELPEFLSGCNVTIRPVVDVRGLPTAGGYHIPDAMRLAVTERWPVDAFPYGTHRSATCDLDHSTPYGEGGATHVDNLAPLRRFSHRARTHGGWELTQPQPGLLVWTSPHGYAYATTPSGTIRIGRQAREHRWWQQEPPDWLDHQVRPATTSARGRPARPHSELTS
ncbi:MAG: DUF222 domain-containing protein [Propioniciclava sp.]|uniref:HNH endonuclease signature motif containing protein n=1 Tax=Propioniciclava sp. TaxID=2038686 RepID=UPI0039E53824